MKLKDIIQTYVGKTLKVVLSVKINEKNEHIVTAITGKMCGGLKELNILLFNDKEGLAFASFDCDGYRDDDWFLIELKQLLDKGDTTELKVLNEKVENISYSRDTVGNCLLIQTTKHLIKMGQDATDSYYPQNFFSIEDCRKFALGEVVDLEES